jgi:hypothetical protein
MAGSQSLSFHDGRIKAMIGSTTSVLKVASIVCIVAFLCCELVLFVYYIQRHGPGEAASLSRLARWEIVALLLLAFSLFLWHHAKRRSKHERQD